MPIYMAWLRICIEKIDAFQCDSSTAMISKADFKTVTVRMGLNSN